MKQMRESRRAMNRPLRMHTYLDGKALREEVVQIVAQMDAIDGSVPVVNFRMIRQVTRSYVGVSPLRRHEVSEVSPAFAIITDSTDAVALYDNMLVILRDRACKGGEGAQWIKQLASRIHRKRTP